MNNKSNETKYNEQIQREKMDPAEGMRPLPWIFTMLLGAMAMWGGFYIVITPSGVHTEYGDQRTVSLLRPAVEGAVPSSTSVNGKQIFIGKCSACHQATGLGLPGVFPPLAGSEWVKGDPVSLTNILLHGIEGELKVNEVTYKGAMPGWSSLSDGEIAAVTSYIRSDWGNNEPVIDEGLVKRQRDITKARSAPYKNAEEIKSGT
jgi:mono/diheme cytochrome c family protein